MICATIGNMLRGACVYRKEILFTMTQGSPKRELLPFEEFRQLVLGESGRRFVYEIDLRRLWKTGMSPAAAEIECRERKLFHRPPKDGSLLGRPREIGVRKRPMLSHYTIMRRLADWNAECCRKLLKHRMSEDDLAMVRKLKADCEEVCLTPPDRYD